jgi:hypothetical protein
MDERIALLDRERRKLLWIKDKLDQQQRRVDALEALQNDPLDEMFDRENSTDVPLSALPPSTPSSEPKSGSQQTKQVPDMVPLLGKYFSVPWIRRPKQLPEKWVRIFDFIGREGKNYTEVKAFIKREGLAISPDAVRTGLMNYRKEFGLVENPKRGQYNLSEHGADVIAGLKNESPAAVGNEASESQPT